MRTLVVALAGWGAMPIVAEAQEATWTYGQLLRSVHVAAFAAPAICPEPGGIALFVANTTGGHEATPPRSLSHLTFDIVGVFPDGRPIIAEADKGVELAATFEPYEETIRCIPSEARRLGATHFSLIIHSARVYD